MLQLVHTCDIARKQALGTNGRRDSAPLYSAVPCLALPVSADATLRNGWELGREYEFFFAAGQDVKVGDKLTYDGSLYSVHGRQDYEVPVVGHVHIYAQQEQP